MEIKNEKCSFIEHNKIDACFYCQECKVYMFNKCSTHHKGLCKNHQQVNLNKDINDIYNELCEEENHHLIFEYYCKNHNILCCDSCITKLKWKGKGQHKDCEVCFLEDIKDEKKKKLDNNIKYLEDLSDNLDNSIKELKNIFEKINNDKDKLKMDIQKTFTKIRSVLNEREDELLSEVDNQYNDLFCNENIIRESEKLPEKIKISLKKCKSLNNEWNDNDKLRQIIINCINIENNINKINEINENIKKCNLNRDEIINFNSIKAIDALIDSIKAFGTLNKKSSCNNIDTLILKNKEEIKKFFDLVSNNIEINNIQLLYRASRDGLNFENIVEKTNNKSNIIFLYNTGNKRIFGVFIKTKLENIVKGKYYKDEFAFVFSLDNNRIYKILIPDKAIIFYKINLIGVGNSGDCNGFYFGDSNDIKIIKDKTLLSEPKIYDFQKDYELTDNLNTFTELEIFEINFH